MENKKKAEIARQKHLKTVFAAASVTEQSELVKHLKDISYHLSEISAVLKAGADLEIRESVYKQLKK